MANVTLEQRDAIIELARGYGQHYSMKIEFTNDPYGLVWVKWPPGGVRNLFIKPDGTRLLWDTLDE